MVSRQDFGDFKRGDIIELIIDQIDDDTSSIKITPRYFISTSANGVRLADNKVNTSRGIRYNKKYEIPFDEILKIIR